MKIKMGKNSFFLILNLISMWSGKVPLFIVNRKHLQISFLFFLYIFSFSDDHYFYLSLSYFLSLVIFPMRHFLLYLMCVLSAYKSIYFVPSLNQNSFCSCSFILNVFISFFCYSYISFCKKDRLLYSRFFFLSFLAFFSFASFRFFYLFHICNS